MSAVRKISETNAANSTTVNSSAENTTISPSTVGGETLNSASNNTDVGGLGAVRDAIFRAVHGSNIVYNTCWEDPRIDREVLNLSADDTLMVLTSAGCNALDYLLAGTGKVHAVDVNSKQNALLELKVAALKGLSYEQFFGMFGRGELAEGRDRYMSSIRPHLKSEYREFWDSSIHLFTKSKLRGNFYFRGSSGLFARMINLYINARPGLRKLIDAAFNCNTLEEQSALYRQYIKPKFWSPFIRWAVGRDSTLAMLGVPHSQRLQVEHGYKGGIVKFIEDSLDSVFGHLSLRDNYFWRLYVYGCYTPECCPEYLKSENFVKLRDLVDTRLETHTCTVTQFLKATTEPISRFVLLDHMDWLSANLKQDLVDEWQAIINNAALNPPEKDVRVIWRSGGLVVDYVDPLLVTPPSAKAGDQKVTVGSMLDYDMEVATQLHELDRVHTYGSFYVADIKRN